MLVIRKFQQKDAKEVSDLIRKTLKQVNRKDYSNEVIENLCEIYSPKNIINSSHKKQIFIAVINSQIVGTASLENNVIKGVFVDPEFHDRKIGTKLMKKIEELAKSKGIKKLILPSSITAKSFYKKMGYKKIKEIIDKKCGKVILMEKNIS